MTLLHSLFASFLLIPIFCNAVECVDVLKPNIPIKGVGIYSSKLPKGSGPQMAYKYSVQLWHSDECYFGYLNVEAGNEGDPPYGMISFRKAPTESKIQFSSKLTMGMQYGGANKPDIPTKDLFEFTGTIDPKEITGTFTYFDKLSNDKPATQKAQLKFEKNSGRDLYLSDKGTTYAKWREDAEQTLKVFGPKW